MGRYRRRRAAPHFYGGTTFNFNSGSGGVQDTESFTLGANQSIELSFQWDSPYFSATGKVGSNNDMDAYVLNSAGTQVVGGSATNNIGGDPVEVFQFTNTTGASATFKLMLVWDTASGGPQPGYLGYVDFAGQATNWQFPQNGATAFGHANAAGAESVAAASYTQTPAFGVSPPVVESFSSTGPMPILFDTSGNRLATAIDRQTPAITAPDNIDNTFFGTDTDSDGYPNFVGTSAAAASAAGVAALLLQKDPSLTPAQVDAALQNTAIDMSTAGYDYSTGFGLIQANAAIASVVGSVSGTVYHDNNGDGSQDNGESGFSGVTVYDDANNNGTLGAGEISTTTASNGTFTLANLIMGSAVIRMVLPGGYVAVTASQTVTVPGGGSVGGANLGLFPDSFTASGGGAVYLLQTDPVKTANIDVYIGATLTYTAAKSILPAISFSFGGSGNQLTVSFLNGNPIPAGGLVNSDGGNGSTGNSLILNGSAAADTVTIAGMTTTFNSSNIFATSVQALTINGEGGNDSFTVDTAQPSGESLTFNGSGGNVSLTVKASLPNSGSTTFFNAGSGSQNTLTVDSGTFQLAGDPQNTSANLTVNDNSNVIFAAAASGTGINPRHLAALSIGAGATASVVTPALHSDRAVLVLGTLSINATGKLDLGANDMIVHNGNLAQIGASLASGYNKGAWNGDGIASSAATGDTALGSLLNNDGSGGKLFTTFDGQSVVTSDVLIKYTYYGDANLDGVVNGSDYTRTDNGFNSSLTGWSNGDFNYDGTVNGDDYTLLDDAFNTQGPPL